MKAIFTKAVLTLALIGFGSAVGTASAHGRDDDRGGRDRSRYEQRWDRHDRHFDHRRFHARGHDRRHVDPRGYRRGQHDGVTIILRDLFR